MSKKSLSLSNLTNAILISSIYVKEGHLIIVYNNSKRTVFKEIAFFELVYQGEDLYLNISKNAEETAYSKKVNLSTVNNINGVPVTYAS